MTQNNVCADGRITAVTENEFFITFEQTSACKSCGMQQFCHQQTMTFDRTEYPGVPLVGQKVELVYKKVVQTAFIIYAIPLFGFFAGMFFVYNLFSSQNDILLVSGALLGCSLGLVLVAWLNKHLSDNNYRVQLKFSSHTQNERSEIND